MNVLKIYLACDHGGFQAKEFAKNYLKDFDYELVDLGVYSDENSVDYPDYADLMALNLKNNPNDFGILICGTGIGISMAANRYNHIRCALCHDENTAKLAREHNNANVLAFGGRNTENETIKKMIDVFFTTDFESGRHERRIQKIGKNNVC